MKKIFPFIIPLIAVIQTLTDAINSLGLDASEQSFLGGVFIFVSITLGAFKQYFDPTTSNRSLWLSVMLFVMAVGGGLLDHFSIFQQLGFSAKVLPIIRLALTILTMYIAQISHLLYPTETITTNDNANK